MKISASKKQLARIISENGGWRDVAEWAAQDEVVAFFSGGKPEYATQDKVWCANGDNGSYICAMEADDKIKCFHNTILSRDEYFHLYPAPDADGWIEWRGGEHPCPGASGVARRRDGHEIDFSPEEHRSWSHGKTCTPSLEIVAYRICKPAEPAAAKPERVAIEPEPTIEQLATDYRAKLAVAKQAQEEADSHRCGAEAALERLYLAGLEIGLDIAIADGEPEDEKRPELVITDWRDLQVGDEVVCVGHSWPGHFEGLTCEVIGVECEGYHGDAAIMVQSYSGGKSWGLDFKFIRRP